MFSINFVMMEIDGDERGRALVNIVHGVGPAPKTLVETYGVWIRFYFWVV